MTRLSLRIRVTLVYSALFLGTGAVLLGLNYTLLDRFLPGPQLFDHDHGHAPAASLQPAPDIPPPGALSLGQAAQIANDLRTQTLHQLLLQSGVALAATALVAGLLGWLVAGRVVAPVKEMTATARRLSERNLKERFDLEGPDDELKALADTFDAMLERLDAAFESRRRFVANASHELRTPLAITRTAVEIQLQRERPSAAQWRDMAERVLASTARSERLIGSLLTLAGIEERAHRREPVDLGAVLLQAAREARAEAAAADVRLDVSARAVPVSGDPELLRRMAANLLENGIRHNHPNGWLEAAVGVEEGCAALVVRNSGEVLAPEALAEIVEPFRRGSTPRTGSAEGSGLGLSIVRSVAEAHAGRVGLAPLGGGGLEVRVIIPLGSPAGLPSPS